MKKILFFILLATVTLKSSAQIFQVDTLQYKGDINKYINILFLATVIHPLNKQILSVMQQPYLLIY